MIRTVIVDDEVLATVGLKAMIDWQAQGYEIVGEGDNGESGLAVIRQTLPDLVITDLKMPGMDGLEMMKRALAEQPGIRFVVLSGYNEFEGVQQALRLGARDYLLKLSLRPDTLLETLALLRRDIRGGVHHGSRVLVRTGESGDPEGPAARTGRTGKTDHRPLRTASRRHPG